jgi:hypothetical protein
MKRALVIALMLLIPAAAFAQPTVGVYFDEGVPPGTMSSDVLPATPLTGYIYAHAVGCYMTAFEYMLSTAAPLNVVNLAFPPQYTVDFGDPLNGHSIAYYPPLNGYVPGYNFLVAIDFLALPLTEGCLWLGGTIIDSPLAIIGHPDTGEIRGTCDPDQTIFQFIGLTSTLCPDYIATKEESWGAIKALYK